MLIDSPVFSQVAIIVDKRNVHNNNNNKNAALRNQYIFTWSPVYDPLQNLTLNYCHNIDVRRCENVQTILRI